MQYPLFHTQFAASVPTMMSIRRRAGPPIWIARLLPLALLTIALFPGPIHAAPATQGLPFTEDFSSIGLQDPALTNAYWSTDEDALVLAWRQRQYGTFGPGLTGSDISADSDATGAMALGDVDGDGDVVSSAAGRQLCFPRRRYRPALAGRTDVAVTVFDATG